MDDEFEISEGLREALRDVAGRDRLEIPEAVDARIRAAARRPRGRLLRIPRVAVAAAAAVLFVAVGRWALEGRLGVHEGATRTVASTGDIDADGQVDVVDAYLLDRRLASAPARGDVDGDGRVDEADVKRLLELVVSLTGRKG